MNSGNQMDPMPQQTNLLTWYTLLPWDNENEDGQNAGEESRTEPSNDAGEAGEGPREIPSLAHLADSSLVNALTRMTRARAQHRGQALTCHENALANVSAGILDRLHRCASCRFTSLVVQGFG